MLEHQPTILARTKCVMICISHEIKDSPERAYLYMGIKALGMSIHVITVMTGMLI